jgi:hypothetical protein
MILSCVRQSRPIGGEREELTGLQAVGQYRRFGVPAVNMKFWCSCVLPFPCK